MNPCEREVVRLPLEGLWNGDGEVTAEKGRGLDAVDIKALLRLGLVTFAVADVGHPLRWVTGAQGYDFWKSEAQPHLHQRARPYLDDYPDGYFYFAHEWLLQDGKKVVVLERHH